MPSTENFLYLDDIHFTESEKNDFSYIQRKMDYFIHHLVHDRERIKKARNLYDGIRDKEEYQYLENVFGIEQPISLKMTPLIKTRVDILIGIFLDENRRFLVSVNDEGTHDKINNEKKNVRIKRIIDRYNKALHGSIIDANNGKEPSQPNPIDEEFLRKMEISINDDFISEFEVAAQVLIKYFEQSNDVDLEQKLKILFLDLLITGECYYRVNINYLGDDPHLEPCKPENIFFNKNTSEQYLNTDAVVHRRFLKRNEILAKYGHLMDDDIKTELFGSRAGLAGQHIVRSGFEVEYVAGNHDNEYISTHQQYTYANNDILEVFEVEWIANNEISLSEEEIKYLDQVEKITVSKNNSIGIKRVGSQVKKSGIRQDRYFGVRLGQYIYLGCGKAKHQIRSQHNPFKTKLTFNGIGYNERNNGKAASLALGLKDLQDLYDITMFHRDNFIANSGVNGSRINLAGIPKILGNNFVERIQKFIAYRKQGLELIDPTEPGAQLFNHHGDFKASIDGNVITSLEVVLQSIERQADIVSGVNRFMYQAAQERDAVSNVDTGIRQTSLITKDLFELMNVNIVHIFTDLINSAKITYKYGKKGSYILGHKTYLFDICPEQFAFTDYNINIVNSQKETVKLEKLYNTTNELVRAGIMSPELALMVTTTESSTDILRMVRSSIASVKEENGQLQKMSEQLQQLDTALKEAQKQLQTYDNQIKTLEKSSGQLEQNKFEFEKYKFEKEYDVTLKDSETSQKLTTSEVIKDKAVIDLEREQIIAENARGSSREVKNDL